MHIAALEVSTWEGLVETQLVGGMGMHDPFSQLREELPLTDSWHSQSPTPKTFHGFGHQVAIGPAMKRKKCSHGLVETHTCHIDNKPA